MKLFMLVFIYFLWVLSARASVEPVLLKEFPADEGRNYQVKFEINKNLNRAWVNVSYWASTIHRRDRSRSEHNIFVAGLFYDAEKSTVRMDTVECARVKTKERGLFRYDLIKPTGCELAYKKTRRLIDNSYYQNFISVFLIIK